jgi:hypothetical protein
MDLTRNSDILSCILSFIDTTGDIVSCKSVSKFWYRTMKRALNMILSLHIDRYPHCKYLQYTPNLERLSGELYTCEYIPVDLKKIKMVDVTINFDRKTKTNIHKIPTEFRTILTNLLSKIPNRNLLTSLKVEIPQDEYYIEYKRDDYIETNMIPCGVSLVSVSHSEDYPGRLLCDLPHKRLICYNFSPLDDFPHVFNTHPSDIEIELYLFSFDRVPREPIGLDSFAVKQTTIYINAPTHTYVIVDTNDFELDDGTYQVTKTNNEGKQIIYNITVKYIDETLH